MKIKIIHLTVVVFCVCINLHILAQGRVKVREVNRAMPTYDFSDPDPVPNIGRIYPYFRFDGYSSQPVEKEWKFIELENDYIKVFITPEIGGKIWGAIEKSTGKEFIYFNHTVKFRDVAMRGPWTSGGIETNFGVIGHAPTCSTPVDYFVRENDDGSVSCFIGAIDLPSRTVWRVEINLQPDKSWFTTKALWYNPTRVEQSYYQWMNAAVKAEGNLEFAYPGTNYIGHDGSLHDWPIHPDGMDISWYEKNNFGGYKSYHVLGQLSGFYGGYWHDDAFGFGHFSDYDAKPGKKLWIWGLSRQGMIWEKLLTDTDGQYVEIQSGRLFNQEAGTSIRTPFKHRGFAPGAADEWTEYWFPVMSTQGIVQATQKAAFNLEVEKDSLHIWLGANEMIDDSLVLELEGRKIAKFDLHMAPTTVVHKTIKFKGSKDLIAIRIGLEYIIPPGGLAGQKLSRPLESTGFDWSTVQGLAIEAKSLAQERNYTKAYEVYLECLEKDPDYIPALLGAAGLYYRKMEYINALKLVRRALSIDAYNPFANFLYGSLNEVMGNVSDALDGYSIATASMEFRSAAYSGLSRIHFRRGELGKSKDYCRKSIDYNSINIPAHELLLLTLRKSGNDKAFQSALNKLVKGDPLSHFSRFEKYLMSGDPDDLLDFKRLIRSELPHETYLELAIKYFKLGLVKEAEMVLDHAPKKPMVLYWLAYLTNLQESNKDITNAYLTKANDVDPALVFPFRQESVSILNWAATTSNSWKPKFYQALIWWNLGLEEKARNQFQMIGDEPDFFPYYLAKAEIFRNNNEVVAHSLERAYNLAPNDWRTAIKLSNYFLGINEKGKAMKLVENQFNQNPTNYYLGLHYAKTLLLTNQNSKCFELLENLNVLPNEGSTEGHHLYRLSKLNLSKEAIKKHDYVSATNHLNKARSWPENLGVGKPYVTDERIEDYIQGLILKYSGKKYEAEKYFEKILSFETGNVNNSIYSEDILVLAAYMQLDRKPEAEKLLKEWQVLHTDDVFVDWSAYWMDGKTKELTPKIKAIQKENSGLKIGSREYYLLWTFDLLEKKF